MPVQGLIIGVAKMNLRLTMRAGTLWAGLLLLSSTVFSQAVISRYAEGKVFLANGFTLEGRDLRMTTETVTIETVGQDQVLPLSEVVQVMAKRGLKKRYGKACGLVAVSVNTLSYLASGGKHEDEDGVEQTTKPLDFVTGAILLGGISYSIGYIAGLTTDHWEVVYLKRL